MDWRVTPTRQCHDRTANMSDTRESRARVNATMTIAMPDQEQCHRAVRSRDPRFDGWFYPAVTSTRIYCRPSCPAITPRTPKPENLRFYPTAAAAQAAGYRACRRCLPDAVPGSPEWDGRADVAARAMRLIDDGLIDREGVEGLAARLGYTSRHLGRILRAELGASPSDLAQARRAHTARLLLEATDVPVTEIAFAAGFGSLRRFNESIRAVFAATPSEIRRRANHGRLRTADARYVPGVIQTLTITLRLPFRKPYDAATIWTHLAAHLVPGLEEMDGPVYRRTLRLHHGTGIAELEPCDGYVRADLRLEDLRDLGAAAARLRRLTHVDADPAGVAEALGGDPVLGGLVRCRPGLRVSGSADPFETAVRSVVGQQVSDQEARTITGRLIRCRGEAIADPAGSLRYTFPGPERLTDARGLALPARQIMAVTGLARAVDEGKLRLDPGADRREVVSQLLELPGVGPWAAEYIALRGLGDPDAFPAADKGIRQALTALGAGNRPDIIDRWRPLRSYAAQHLWTALAAKDLPGCGNNPAALVRSADA